MCHNEGEMAHDDSTLSNHACCCVHKVRSQWHGASITDHRHLHSTSFPTLVLTNPLHHSKPILWPTEELAHTLPISLLSFLPSQRTEPSSAMSVTVGSLRRLLSRDTLYKSTVTSPTSVTAARPPSATRGTLPATKLSTQVQCRSWGQRAGEAVGSWAHGCLWLGLSQVQHPLLCHKLSLMERARRFQRASDSGMRDMLPGLAAGMELKLLCCKALGTTVSKDVLQSAWWGADVWLSGYFVVGFEKTKQTKKKTFREKPGIFFPLRPRNPDHI